MDGKPDFLEACEESIWAVYGFLAYRTRSVADAEDLTQQTFEKALRGWAKFDPARGEVRTWLLAIARNVYVDWRRAGRRRTEATASVAGMREATESSREDPAARLPSPEIQAALARLGTREREAIALRFGGDLPIREIAEILEVSHANAQQVLSRALRKLRRLLEADRDQLRIDH